MPDEALNRWRNLFISDINTLANRGLIDNSKLGDLKSPNGHKNLSEAVSALTAHLRRNWDSISARTGVTLAELDEAEITANRMLLAVARRDSSPLPPTQAAIERRQAFTMFSRSYDQVRRYVAHVRWSFGDADDFAPPLRSVDRKSARSDGEESAQPAPTPAAAPAPVTFAAVPAGPAAAGPLTRPGLPNSSPIGEG